MEKEKSSSLTQAVNKTQRLLGEYLQKPILSEKYLMKPPFRFLHDVFISTIETTGFLKNVFSEDETKPSKVSSVDEKRSVLKKAIAAIENETGEKCSARPSRILTGKEPEKTNELLQLLSKAIHNFQRKSTEKNSLTDDKTGSSKNASHKESQDGINIKSKDVVKQHSPSPIKQAKRNDNPKAKISDPLQTKSVAQARISLKRDTVKSRMKPDASSKDSSTSKPTQSNTSIASCTVSKSKSKQTLVKKASTTKLVLVPKQESKEVVKMSSKESIGSTRMSTSHLNKSKQLIGETKDSPKLEEHHNEDVNASELMRRSTEIPSVSTISSKTSLNSPLPPESDSQIPLQRPVTRTKYRQNNDSPSNELTSAAPSENVQSQMPPSAETEKVDPNEVLKVFKSLPVSEDEHTSSEEGSTEEMNQKVSEWKTDSATVETLSLKPEEITCKVGWMQQNETTNDTNLSCSNSNNEFAMNKVFTSTKTIRDESRLRGSVGEHQNLKEQSAQVGEPNRKIPLPLNIPDCQVQANKTEASQQSITKSVAVILDNDEDDDDDAFLVHEKVESERDLALDRLQNTQVNTASDLSFIPRDQRGLLVDQIVETQRELEQLGAQHTKFAFLQNEMAERDKEALREVYLKQIEDLREAIQKMAKCANPLANIIQRAQDDACLMEIEYKKLKQENERLQRSIDESKARTARTLFPLTEELGHLDSRIEKMDAAIVLAKQRLHILDEQYCCDYIHPISQCPTPDEGESPTSVSSLMWDFAAGNSEDDGGDELNGKLAKEIVTKSMINVFQKAISMHEGSGYDAVYGRDDLHALSSLVQIVPKIESTQSSENHLRMSQDSRQRQILREWKRFSPSPPHQLGLAQGDSGSREQKERLIHKDIKPPWWD